MRQEHENEDENERTKKRHAWLKVHSEDRDEEKMAQENQRIRTEKH
jgi:hypothetical protein